MKSREKILVSAVIWQRLGWKWGGGGANCSPHDAEGFPGQRRGHIEPSIARSTQAEVSGREVAFLADSERPQAAWAGRRPVDA